MQLPRLVPGIALALACGACSKSAPPPASAAPPLIEVPTAIVVDGVPAEERAGLPPPDPDLRGLARAAFVELAGCLDAPGFLADYGEIARSLRTGTREQCLDAARMCGASHDLRTIPILVSELRIPDREHQIAVALALEQLVSWHELQRRDPARPEAVHLLPRKEGETDLRPLRWVVEQLLRSGEPNLQAYACSMAGYLGLDALTPLLEALRSSRHPAAAHAAQAALAQLELDRPR